MEKQRILIVGGTDGIGNAVAHALSKLDAVCVEAVENRGPETIYFRSPAPMQEFYITDRRRVGKGERKRNRANRYR